MKKTLYYIGNILIALSVFVTFITYLPFIKLYFSTQQQIDKKIRSSFFIEIPKINAAAPIIPNVDPWDQKKYLPVLEKGVAQADSRAIKGAKGSAFLFAHSSDVPWRIGRYNTAFFRLRELKNNDKIFIFKNGKKYEYIVFDKKEVWPNDVKSLSLQEENSLILQTCTPIGTSLKRLLVFGKLKKT